MTGNKKKFIAGAIALALVGAGVLKVIAAAIFIPDNQPVGYIGQPVASNGDVSSGNEFMYAIDYDAINWKGNLHKYTLSAKGAIGTEDKWGTGGADAQITSQTARLIVTAKVPDGSLNIDPKASGTVGTPFQWKKLSQKAGGQQAALDPGTDAGADSSPILDYIRGSSANEGKTNGKYRPRSYVLGDIIHSTPVYWNDGTNATVFVGANDGMMHAINASDGTERFAYIPSVLMPKLKDLSDQAYLHEYFVDGRLDVKTIGAKTILVGTTGAGGKAVFALNVTNAAATDEDDAASKVMWEITNTTKDSDGNAVYANLGYTYSAPTLITLPNKKPALVVGNGYNNSGNGHAVLYLIDPLTGAKITEFDTTGGTPTAPNGLSSVSLWSSNGDGSKDVAYAGDLNGNLWKFNLKADSSGKYDTSGTLLFTTTDGHPITMAPGLSAHPKGGVMVDFVTGRMLSQGDATDTSDHYAYGIWDGHPDGNDSLVEQVLSETTYTVPGSKPAVDIRVRTVLTTAPNWDAGHDKGWKVKLPTGGERVVGDGAFVTAGVFQFFSTNPAVKLDQLPAGENWWMQLNALTGGESRATLFDLNSDSAFNSADQVQVDRSVTDPDTKKVSVVKTSVNPVGRYMGGGVRSQLIPLSAGGVDIFQSNYDKNSAPAAPTSDTTVEVLSAGTTRGVAGGHFDTDFFCYDNCGDGEPTYHHFYSPPSFMADLYGGPYGNGREVMSDSSNDFAGLDTMKYIHVHQYDKVYDKTGINMLNPSQELQRLGRAQGGAMTAAYSPNTPDLKSNYKTAPGAVKTGPTFYGTYQGRSYPNDQYSYVDSAPVPVANSTTGSMASMSAQYTYTTTLTIGSGVNSRYSYYDGWIYDWQYTVYTWSTTVTYTLSTPQTKFKVLLMNQALSPAVKVSIDGKEDNVYNVQTGSSLAVKDLPTYDLTQIKSLFFEMPVDAFNTDDWAKTGTKRPGLLPIYPDCVGIGNETYAKIQSRWGPVAAGEVIKSVPVKPEPNHEWRDGALTMQIVSDSIKDNDIQRNVDGDPSLGYRLKNASVGKDKLIAEYVIYWHHPTNPCYGNKKFKIDPGQEKSTTGYSTGVSAPFANDPSGGRFTPVDGGDVVPLKITPGTTKTTTTDADGNVTTVTVVIVANADGSYTRTTTTTTIPKGSEGDGSKTGIVTGGAVGTNGKIEVSGVEKNAPDLGRITWREVKQ
jgi:type IV pilus assembly protein PilY1